MRIYISGPITGHLDTYEETFAAAADTIRKGGHEPVSSTGIKGSPDWSWWQWMDACIPLLKTCQGIYMLPGWRESRGATVEWHTAQALGLRLFGYELEHP